MCLIMLKQWHNITNYLGGKDSTEICVHSIVEQMSVKLAYSRMLYVGKGSE